MPLDALVSQQREQIVSQDTKRRALRSRLLCHVAVSTQACFESEVCTQVRLFFERDDACGSGALQGLNDEDGVVVHFFENVIAQWPAMFFFFDSSRGSVVLTVLCNSLQSPVFERSDWQHPRAL